MIKEIQRIKAPARNINIAFALCIWLGLIATVSTYGFFSPDSEYDICVDKYNEEVAIVNMANSEWTKSCIKQFEDSPYELSSCMNQLSTMPLNYCVNKGTWKVTEEDVKIDKLTLRDKFGLWDCRFINDFHRLGKYNLEWMAYDIACEVGKSFDVKSPWDYKLSYKWYWANLWDYIILENINNPDTKIVLWHTVNSDEQNTIYKKGDIIWQTNVSGASTWMHVHIELWDGYNNVSREFALGEKYKSINGTTLLNHRKWDFGQQKKDVYYFTHYDLWDPNQNDASPCIWASGKDLCYLERTGVRTMALTSDIRNTLGVNFGEKVKLVWDKGCEGIFQVEDDMNVRYRSVPWVLRPNTPYYIKGDLPSMEGWVCSVTKL